MKNKKIEVSFKDWKGENEIKIPIFIDYDEGFEEEMKLFVSKLVFMLKKQGYQSIKEDNNTYTYDEWKEKTKEVINNEITFLLIEDSGEKEYVDVYEKKYYTKEFKFRINGFPSRLNFSELDFVFSDCFKAEPDLLKYVSQYEENKIIIAKEYFS